MGRSIMKNTEKTVNANSKTRSITETMTKLDAYTSNLAKLAKSFERQVNVADIPPQWILIPLFASLTGYSEKAVRRKIEDGVWLSGKHFKKAPDGRITMNLQEYYKWVEQS